MTINELLKFFVPKDESFFPLFEGQAKCISEAAKLLNDIAYTDTIEVRIKLIKDIRKLEHEGDNYTHRVYEQLNKSFLSPFDREDIHTLAHLLDDVLDHIYAVSQRIEWYKFESQKTSSEFKAFVEIINEMSKWIELCVSYLRSVNKNNEKILDACVNINTLENKADVIYYEYMSNLLDVKESDFVNTTTGQVAVHMAEIIKKKDIFQTLEKCADAAEDVSDIIKTILIKNV